MDSAAFKVLIVDDSPLIRQMLHKMLSVYRYLALDEAADGEAALTKLTSSSFDLVLLDWNMPKMSGLDLLKKIRADEKLRDTYVVMITARSKKDSVIAAIKAGANEYMIKPFSAEAVAVKLKRVLANLLFGDFLVKQKIISSQQLQKALDEQKIGGKTFGEVAISLGLLTSGQVEQVLEKQKKLVNNVKFGMAARIMDFLTVDQIKTILEAQGKIKPKLGEILIKQGAITEEKLKKSLLKFHNLKYLR